MLPLTTNRLIIREMTLDDAPFVLELLNDPGFLQHIGDRGVRNLPQAEAYISNGPLASYAQHGHGLYLVSLKADQTPVGTCGLLQRGYLDDPDIGFAFLENYAGKGYAFESASAIMAYSRKTLETSDIVAITSLENDRSARLLEKLGLRYIKNMVIPGETKQTRFFST